MKFTLLLSTIGAFLRQTCFPAKILAVLLIVGLNLQANETLIVGRPRNADDEATIRSLEAESGRAVATRDYATLERIWSEDFVVNAPNSRVVSSRAAVFSLFKRSKVDMYASYEKSIECIAFDGDVAVVMGFETVTPVEGPGAGKPAQRRYTNVWRFADGAWRLFARQATFPASNPGMPELPKSN